MHKVKRQRSQTQIGRLATLLENDPNCVLTSTKEMRQIIAEEWQKIVRRYGLPPGSVTEKFTGRLMQRLIQISEK